MRRADVYILLSKLEGLGLDWACCKHWAVIVKFDNRTIAYEIEQVKDESGISRITPKWSHLKNTGKFGSMIRLGEVMTSPQIVRYMAAENSYNQAKYDFVFKNCQEWARKLLRAMGPHLEEALDEKNIKPICATLCEKVTSSYQSSSWSS